MDNFKEGLKEKTIENYPVLVKRQKAKKKSGAGHTLNRIYNCTKHGIRPIDNVTTTHFTLHISILQLHKL